MRKVLAICDEEEEYVRKLMRYLNECEQIPFEVEAYTSQELLRKAAEENPPSVLLISKTLMGEAIKELGIETILLLSKEGENDRSGEYPFVPKYQAVSNIVREVMGCYMGAVQAVMMMVGVKQSKICGIYSPIKNCGKTTLSLALSYLLAKEQKILYLNLEGQSGFAHLFQRENQADITDAIYYFRQGREKAEERMGTILKQMEGFSYFPPALYEEDMKSIEGQEWELWLKFLAEKSGYEIIIIDVGDSVRGVGRILNLCDKIFMPIKTDLISQAKLREGLEALDVSGFGAKKEQIRQFQVFSEPIQMRQVTDFWKVIKEEAYLNWVKQLWQEEKVGGGT